MKRRELKLIRDNKVYAFALGEIVESLQGAGVPTEGAINIAKSIEKHYRGLGNKTIKLEKLVNKIAKTLEVEVDKDVADRFRVQTPPFVPLEIQSTEEIRPFSRKALARSLEKLGLRFKDAYAVTAEVEQSLRSKGYQFISSVELNSLFALALETRFGRDVRMNYEASLAQPLTIQIEEEEQVFPFSRGILAQSLMEIGLGPELAYTFAKHVEEILWQKGLNSLHREKLREEVKTFLFEEAGEEFAKRYARMRAIKRPDKPIVILLGGAPGVGKSILASELAYRLGIRRVVSSDAVREALRSLISKELSPSLHLSSFTAWHADLLPSEAALSKPKRKRVIRGFQTQAQQLNTAIMAIIGRNVEEATSLVVEGTHLVPGLLPLDHLEDVSVFECVLVLDDKKRHQKNFVVRDHETNHKRPQQSYLDHFDEIRIIHDFVSTRAYEEGVAVIETSNFDSAIDQTIEHILDVSFTQEGSKGEKANEVSL